MTKTTFSKQTTEKIVEYWGLGFTAEGTRQLLTEKDKITISLHSIYNHRRSLTAQNLIDELIRKQGQAIYNADADNPALAMKYRNELLKILVPQRIETLGLSKHEEKLIIELWQPPDQGNNPLQPPRRSEAVPPSPIQNTV